MTTATLDPLNLPDHDQLAAMSAHDAAALFQQLEAQRRALEAAMADVIGAAESAGHHSRDGHRSVTGWCRSLGRWSGGDSVARARTARLARADTVFGAAMRAGQIGVAQCHLLAKAFANPRCGHQLSDVMPIMLEHAQKMCFDDFRTLVNRWEMLADTDGAHRDAAVTHARRTASINSIGTAGNLSAKGCTSHTAAMAEILEHFTRAEWESDWAQARAEHGAATTGHLRRTDAQRRFDALHRIFERAAGSPTDSGPAVTIDYLIDHHTMSALLHRDTTADTGTDASPDPARRRCETATGTVVPPATIVDAMWWGQIRRVVTDSASVVIDMGRRQRLFTGSARDAVMLASARCVNPGCSLPVTWCEGSHLDDWQHEGPTASTNGAPECGHHNRLHNHGFTVRRDEHGYWHTYRPDGTELTEPPAA
jgi:hypothetical protein